MNHDSHELYRLPAGQYKVKSFKLEKELVFSNIEAAAETLESVGVLSDEIDIAIVTMFTQQHNHANFGILNGTFIFSDKVEFT